MLTVVRETSEVTSVRNKTVYDTEWQYVKHIASTTTYFVDNYPVSFDGNKRVVVVAQVRVRSGDNLSPTVATSVDASYLKLRVDTPNGTTHVNSWVPVRFDGSFGSTISGSSELDMNHDHYVAVTGNYPVENWTLPTGEVIGSWPMFPNSAGSYDVTLYSESNINVVRHFEYRLRLIELGDV